MDSDFSFLDTAHAELLDGVLARRNPDLLERVRQGTSVSRSDAEEIVSLLGKEVTNNLDEDWEPTENGLAASAVLARFNAARVTEWP